MSVLRKLALVAMLTVLAVCTARATQPLGGATCDGPAEKLYYKISVTAEERLSLSSTAARDSIAPVF
jgi:hypothetical protein